LTYWGKPLILVKDLKQIQGKIKGNERIDFGHKSRGGEKRIDSGPDKSRHGSRSGMPRVLDPRTFFDLKHDPKRILKTRPDLEERSTSEISDPGRSLDTNLGVFCRN